MNLVIYILRRLAISIPVLFVGTFLVFVMVAATGDPLAELRGRPNVNPEAIAETARQLGLDMPLIPRYFHWLGHFLTGDWGVSVAQGNAMQPVFPKVMSAFDVTIKLVVGAEVLALIIGIAVGVLAAVKQYSIVDYVATTLAFFLFSMPIFCVAVVLKTYAIQLNVWIRDIGLSDWLGNPWLRTTSPENLTSTGFGDFLARYSGAYLLPTLSIMAISFAAYSRFQRASMLETLNQDYVRTARAKGISGSRVIFRHAFRNALIPVATLFSVNFGQVLTGAIITETVFNWHGMGTLLVDAVNHNDPSVLMGWLVVVAVMVVLANLIADLLYGIMDPRIRVG
ncbi:ABC transporter permease [Amycolatopsis acidiphila]|uniref:ABC transporter permease n=1 Tax=Amycolatopsis acidiphila TaxID=715473 RepID=A0A558A4A6_9PSEU|nr:ABC transporter permease [Amycolatopsis acidiphila]TVT19099.1 ABC transporter permease [Amycolatopsis acidiphila]UIJ58918.1 ABC transporter permease [Amycolatopsis acidiphila]GHG72767.1 peptide ABC transporter permease [Amycolatopsis acidiphila]